MQGKQPLTESPDCLATAGATALFPRPAPAREWVIHRADLVNKLNFINFSGQSLAVRFVHRKHGTVVAVRARIEPSSGETVRCIWEDGSAGFSCGQGYDCSGFSFDDEACVIEVRAASLERDGTGILFQLPETAIRRTARRIRRVVASAVSARVLQKGASFQGSLEDFTPRAFRMRFPLSALSTYRWIDPDQNVTVLLESAERQMFSGDCRILRVDEDDCGLELVVAALDTCIRRCKPRQHRSHRHTLCPAPGIRFRHPLTGGRVFLKARDISGSGFAVEEQYERSMLMPGMLIHDVAIEVAGYVIAVCTAQVLYSQEPATADGQQLIRSGLVILDMAADGQKRLSTLLHQAANDRISVSECIDPDQLWRFFFECGFIYPAKYAAMEPVKAEFRRTYEKLYLESPSIARHFMFQEHGSLYAHLSMVRFYADAWLIQHHAAGGAGHNLAGIEVLDHVGAYVNEVCSMASAHMNYVMCYFRPENKFPDRVFGGVVRDLASPKEASIDVFGFCRIGPDLATGYHGEPARSDSNREKPVEPSGQHLELARVDGHQIGPDLLAGHCQLEKARPLDFIELQHFYERVSGGLMLAALDLRSVSSRDTDLDTEFREAGFSRSRDVLALRVDGQLKAVVMITRSDLGLNLSSLANCIHLFVVDTDDFTPELATALLATLVRDHAAAEVPVMVYPREAAEALALQVEKHYALWVISTRIEKEYFGSLGNTFRRPVHV
jgi:hypothetical protein